MSDPLIARLLCSGSQEYTIYGPGYSQASIFSLPEEGGGERLYLGFVRDLRQATSKQAFWRGPVATRWEYLREVPEHKSSYTAPNPARYRIDRLTRFPSGRLEKAVMEIDLDAQPPQLRLVGDRPTQPNYLKSQPLGEELTLNGALRLLTRMRQEATADTRVLGLRAYRVVLGDEDGVIDKPYWNKDSSISPYLLTVCSKFDPRKTALHFLPQRINGWEFNKLLHMPEQGDMNGTFTAQMFSLYWGPSVNGTETVLGSRSHVRVSLSGMDIKPVASQLHNDPETGEWSRPESVMKNKAKQ